MGKDNMAYFRCVVVVSALASASAFNLAPASLRASSFRANKDAAVSAKPAFAVAPKARSGRAASITMQASGLKRVVVTGMGITSCLGNDLDTVADNLKNAKSGIRYRQEFSDFGIKSHLCGWPDLTEADYKAEIPRQTLRFMGDNAKYAYIALKNALKDAGLEPKDYENNPEFASILGQGGTSLQDVVETADAVRSQAPRWQNKVGPFRVTRSMGSTVSAVLATAFKIQGPSWSISSACSTGAHCIGTGFEQIQLGKSDIAFCGAGEAEDWGFSAMFDCMGALSTARNDDPLHASRAFDQDRDGFVIAGGGGVVVLEELEHAKARGAKIYAELVGYGANSDGYDMVAPSGVGGEQCMKIALDMANKSVQGDIPVDYINTHGTSTPVGDVMELGAVKRTFLDGLGYSPNIGSTKSLSGHSLGAAGVHEAIYSLLMLDRGFLAQSANIENLTEEAEGLNVLAKDV